MKGLQEEWKRKEQSNFGNVVKVENYVILSLLGDGDCSSYNTLCAMNDGNGIYGEGIPVRKEKCVNHFHKRMGTAIRKLVDESTVEHTTKKGKKINKRLYWKGKVYERSNRKTPRLLWSGCEAKSRKDSERDGR